MKSILRISFLSSLILILFVSCSNRTNEPDGRRLREIVEDKYSDGSIIIGATIGQESFGSETGRILDAEFSYVTPENDFKQWMIHPDNETWDWSVPDAWIDHIAENNQILRILLSFFFFFNSDEEFS